MVKSGKVLLGFKESLRAVKLGKAKAVVVASKIPKEYYDDISYYAGLSNIPVIRYPKSSSDLGIACGRPFPISTIAIIELGDSRLLELVRRGG